MFRDELNVLLKNKNLVLFVTTAFYLIGLFAYFQNCVVPTAVILSIALILAFVFNYISGKLTLVWLLAFYLAFLNATLRTSDFDQLSAVAPQNATISGRVLSIPNNSYENKSKFFFMVDSLNYQNKTIDSLNAKTFVTLNSDDRAFPILKIGNAYQIKGTLKSPFKSGNPSQFDYGKYLKNYGVHTLFYADASDCSVLALNLDLKQKFMQSLNDIRSDIIDSHSKYLKSPNLEVVGGIVFGDDAVSPPDYIKTSFVNSGLLHILAASGMNVAFIFGFWVYILSRLKVPFKSKVLSGIVLVILYALMTGLGPSVLRATYMLVIVLIGKLINRDTDTVALLAFVALLLTIVNPAFINDVGFQLSFIVTFGILVTSPVVFQYTKKIPDLVSGAIFIPVIAQIWVIPIQMFYFNTISTYSVFANIAAVPLISIISFGGFVSSILSVIRPISDFVCMVFDFVLNPVVTALLAVSGYFSTLPMSIITTTHPSLFQVVLYYLLLLTLIFVLKHRQFRKTFLYAFSVMIFIWVLTILPYKNKNTEIIAFDVQNANSFLIKTPQNKYIGIDTGKSGYKTSSQASSVMLKYMKDKGIKSLDTLIITHFDNDHSGGAVDYLKQLKIKNVVVNSLVFNSATAQQIFHELKNHKDTKLLKATNNTKIYDSNNFKLTLFIADLVGERYENENSVITLLESGDFKMLFMGDAGISGYNHIRQDVATDIDVLKVGHHGAKEVVNNVMLKDLTPEVSVISVGENTFGHPALSTLELLDKTKILRTDDLNSIKIIVKKDKPYSILHYDKLKKKYVKL